MEWFDSTPRLAALVPLALVAADIIRRIIRSHVQSRGYPLPPGPKPLPVIGSILSVSTDRPWLTYTEWKEQYGDIMHVRLLDSDVIVLNTVPVAADLLEKRSQVYSDRPFVATVAPYGHDRLFVFSRYGDYWRLCRRIFHQTFRPNAALTFRPMQLHRARKMMVAIDDHPDPEGYMSRFATYSAAVAMSAVYDYEPSPLNDPMVEAVDKFIQASLPEIMSEKTVLLKVFPFLLHIPDWCPGSWIQREARLARGLKQKVIDTPYQYVQKRMESKEHINAAMVSDHIARMQNFDDSYRSDYESALKHSAASAFIGSVETTSSTLMMFTLAMVENPHVWKRAQVEIDAAIGADRLPEFDDRANLPYVDAIVRETLRWKPVVPLGVPHSAMRDDVYRGYLIPKGAVVMPNTWAMSRDEARYPDPERFIPERFLDAEGMLTDDDPSEFVFGFGRRICPGRYTADASVWGAIVTMLATLDFNLAKDANGDDIAFTATFSNGITYHPHPFPCRLTLRPHLSKEVFDRFLDRNEGTSTDSFCGF